ncbi:response regulator transcription factor [Arcanobacterium haemolyticum]|nr:response regulator transcription factor [Arcanobacterium haemolyticum]
MTEELASKAENVKVLVFSDDATTRHEVVTAVGRRAAKGQPEITWKEVATPDIVMAEARENDYALLILDAEAPKFGGMGLGKMIHDEIDPNIPFIALIGRQQDEWLSRWSGAAATVSYPVNPRELSEAVAQVLATRI